MSDKPLRQRRIHFLHRRCEPRDVEVDQLQRIAVGERRRTGEEFVQRRAERIQVGSVIDDAIHAAGLLRRNVRQRPGEMRDGGGVRIFARRKRREAEIDQPHEFLFGIADDVCRIDVAMDDAFVVNRLQRLTELDRHREFLLERQIALADQFAQRRCVHVFEQDAAVVFGQFDARARHRGSSATG